MITIQQAQTGAINFIQNEVTSQMSGWQKLVAETAVGLYVNKLPEKINSILENPMIKELDIVKDGKIDVDKVYEEASKHFTSPIAIKIPVLGNIQFTKDDLDVLYTYLTNTTTTK